MLVPWRSSHCSNICVFVCIHSCKVHTWNRSPDIGRYWEKGNAGRFLRYHHVIQLACDISFMLLSTTAEGDVKPGPSPSELSFCHGNQRLALEPPNCFLPTLTEKWLPTALILLQILNSTCGSGRCGFVSQPSCFMHELPCEEELKRCPGEGHNRIVSGQVLSRRNVGVRRT